MKKNPDMLDISTMEMNDETTRLRDLVDHVSVLINLATKIYSKLSKYDQNPEILSGESAAIEPRYFENNKKVMPGNLTDTNMMSFSSGFKPHARLQSNIIPFPGSVMHTSWNTKTTSHVYKEERFPVSEPFLALPGMPLPPDIHDFRPHLQRDGLILLAWDIRETELGDRYTAYWVTSTGIPRFYASKQFSSTDFISARPHHKSYAAEDGIEFYGQEAPIYLVHVAPDLMKSNPLHRELREVHIKLLKSQGSNVDFNYKFLLKTDKNLKLPIKKLRKNNPYQAGA